MVVRMLASAGMAIEIEHYTFGVGTEVVKSRLWRDPAKAKRRRGGLPAFINMDFVYIL